MRIIQWQAPSLLNSAATTGVKDYLGGQIVLEPLMHFDANAMLVPNLVNEVPTQENGLLGADLTTVTFNIMPDVLWSDGTPFTAEDVTFTWQWSIDPTSDSQNSGLFETISEIVVPDPPRAQITFAAPNSVWFSTFAGSAGFVLPKHILEVGGQEVNDAFKSNPIGTGPYIVESFVPNDQVIYAINENYRHPNKPYFAKINLKGGGDVASAARAVLQTGDNDYAWNLQVEPDVPGSLISDDGPGYVGLRPTTNVERIDINFSDPNQEVDGQRSEKNTPHPFFTDPAVRQALATAIDRDLIALRFCGEGNPAAVNVISGIEDTESPNTMFEFNQEAAAQLLEDAGWVMDGDIRAKDGVELSLN